MPREKLALWWVPVVSIAGQMVPSSGQDWRWDPEVGRTTGVRVDKTRGIHEDPQATSWSPTFVNLLVFNTCVYGACVCQHECDFLRTCDLCHTYVYVHACSYMQVYFCVRIHIMFVQSTQRCCKAQETGSDGRMKIQVISHLHVRCRLRHITLTPQTAGKAAAFLSSQCLSWDLQTALEVPQRTVPMVMTPARCHGTNRDFHSSHASQ